MPRYSEALAAGFGHVRRAPGLVIAVFVSTLIVAVPFALVLGSRLRTALSEQLVAESGPAQIDAEWWQEFRLHAKGLEATFTPSVMGFAAPLDSVSALLDGERRPLILAAPVALYAVLWTFLWGGILERFLRGRLGVRAFVAAGARRFLPLFTIALVAVAVYATLYATVHAWLFGPVFATLEASVATERAAFLWRVVLYAGFVALLIVVNAIVDFTRIHVVADGTRPLRESLGRAMHFVRAHAATVAALYIASGCLVAVLFALYGAVEIVGGAQVGGWRAVLLGQAYIGARLVLRLGFAASTVALFAQATAGDQRSAGPASSGPPAAR